MQILKENDFCAPALITEKILGMFRYLGVWIYFFNCKFYEI